MATRIWSHNPGSNSAEHLAVAVDARILSAPSRTSWMPRSGDVIVNWGNSQFNGRIAESDRVGVKILNQPTHVRQWSDKRQGFGMAQNEGIVTVPHTRDRQAAEEWRDGGAAVVVRHKLRGHSGEGIEIIEAGQDMPRAPLYTYYIKKTDEYRVHFIRDGSRTRWLWQKKLRRMSMDAPNWRVRNYENGFIYSVCDNNDDKPDGWGRLQAQINDVIPLDYGAVDLIWATRTTNPLWALDNGRLMFLELNTAPGIASDSLRGFYTNHLRERIRYEQQQ